MFVNKFSAVLTNFRLPFHEVQIYLILFYIYYDFYMRFSTHFLFQPGSVRVAERLALPTLDHGVAGSNPAGGEILTEPKRCFFAQSLSCSPFHRLEMTEILLKGRKTLTHPSIFQPVHWLSAEIQSLSAHPVLFLPWSHAFTIKRSASYLEKSQWTSRLLISVLEIHHNFVAFNCLPFCLLSQNQPWPFLLENTDFLLFLVQLHHKNYF